MIRISIFFVMVFMSAIHLHGQEIVSGSIMHDGISRDYHIYVPSTYVAGNPLLLNFHGSGNTGLAQMFYGNFMEIADTAGFLIVSPDGTLDPLGFTHWNVGFNSDSNTDDVGFVGALIDSLHLEYNFDPERVYSTGMSNGGFLSYLLACEMSDRIAGIASVTGSMTLGLDDDCNCQHPMPVMQIHGTADPVVPYNGGGFFTSINDVIEYWLMFNSIPEDPDTYIFPDISSTDGSTAERWLYQNEDTGIDLSLIRIIGGGHTWPGALAPTQNTNYDIDASVEIWKFLSKYRRTGATTSIDETENASSRLHYYVDYSTGHLVIDWKKEPADYRILNMMGQQVLQGSVLYENESIDLNKLPAGWYVLVLEDSAWPFIK